MGTLALFVWGLVILGLLAWGTPYILAHTGAFLAGGLLGVGPGRPPARGIVTLLLPPRLRQALVFLWLVDRKPPPGAAPVMRHATK